MANLAIIGAGYWGKNLARNFLELGALHSLCDPRIETLAEYRDGYEKITKLCRSEEIWINPEIDRVAIAAPASLHYALAREALLANKHVFVEKPLCLSIREGEELIQLAQDRQRVLMVGHLLQYHPCVVRLRELISTGSLGRLFYVTSNRLNLGKIRREENALWSFAPHDISVILSLADALPESVQCVGEHYLTRGVADTTLTQMSFHGGLKAHVYVSWMNPFKEQKLTVIGSAGMAVFDDTRPWKEKLCLFQDYLTWEQGQVPVAKKAQGIFVEVDQSEPLRNECEHFLTCCDQKTQPRTDGREGNRVLQVLEAAQRSLETQGQRISLHRNAIDFFVHPTATVDARARVGKDCKVWHYSHVSDGAQLGDHCNLGQNVFVAPQVVIGDNVKIQNNVSIYSGTVIEDHVFLGPSCVLTNISNPRSEVARKSLYERTLIRRGATIGANATIVCGVTIGQFAFVAAGAVVTRDVPDYGMVKGNPARRCGWMSRHAQRLSFDNHGLSRCPESGLTYRLQPGQNPSESKVTCLELDEQADLPIDMAVGKKAYREFR
jgi:UDP-2-acetamido-3-amino-2,3-dideoxy-glucuronate N-acetyltransferase